MPCVKCCWIIAHTAAFLTHSALSYLPLHSASVACACFRNSVSLSLVVFFERPVTFGSSFLWIFTCLADGSTEPARSPRFWHARRAASPSTTPSIPGWALSWSRPRSCRFAEGGGSSRGAVQEQGPRHDAPTAYPFLFSLGIVLTVSGGYQSQKVGVFPFNPPLRA